LIDGPFTEQQIKRADGMNDETNGANDAAMVPLPTERAAARQQPGGWLYRIAGGFSDTEAVPPEAIFGAWKIDDEGEIVGEFHRNPNYDPERFPVADVAQP
jgi:hypothetical protein